MLKLGGYNDPNFNHDSCIVYYEDIGEKCTKIKNFCNDPACSGVKHDWNFTMRKLIVVGGGYCDACPDLLEVVLLQKDDISPSHICGISAIVATQTISLPKIIS